MKGSPKVIEYLQKLLNNELAARDQYFAHAEMYKDWGLYRLYERLDHEREEETEHAQMLIERMLFLEATPNLGTPDALNVGGDVEQMLRNDLEVEYAVDALLKEAIQVCEQEQDYDTRRILIKLLDDTEMDHAYFLEKQLGLIQKIGLPNYIQSQMGEEPSAG
jgi:bacterioferritin